VNIRLKFEFENMDFNFYLSLNQPQSYSNPFPIIRVNDLKLDWRYINETSKYG